MLKAKVRTIGANHLEIDTAEGTYLQSYNTIIAFKSHGGKVTILDRQKWDYSNTTAKHRNHFLQETTKETRRKINEGIYLLDDLN